MEENPSLSYYDAKHISRKHPEPKVLYIPDYSDPEHRRDEAIKETISLLQITSGKTSLPDDDIPAAVWFNRATDLSNKLVSVGFRD